MKMQWKRLGSGLLAAGFLISTLGIGAMAAQSPVEKDERSEEHTSELQSP